MPSVYQQAGHQGYKPSEYGDEFDEDPARFLDCGEELAIARIRGIDDPELLTAYVNVEGERQARRDVIALINRRIAAIEDND